MLGGRRRGVMLHWCVFVLAGLAVSYSAQATGKKDPPTPGPITKIIVTTQGGNGHLQAAERVKQDLQQQGIPYKVIDIINEKYLKSLVNVGKYGVSKWNRLNKRGKVKGMDRLAGYQWLAENWYGHRFFKKIFRELVNHPEVDEIIDTQPLNSDQILKAVYVYNTIAHQEDLNHLYNNRLDSIFLRIMSLNKKGFIPVRKDAGHRVMYRKILTDLPTDRAEHFLGSIKKVQGEHAQYMVIETPASPQDDSDGHRTKAFFHSIAPQLFSDPDHNPIKISPGPIRHGFLSFISNQASKDDPLHIKVTHKDEYQATMATMGADPRRYPLQDNHFSLTVGLGARVHSIMLGSQVNESKILTYIDNEITLYNELGRSNLPLYFFVFTGANTHKTSLFNRVVELIEVKKKQGLMPPQLRIVPLSLQDDALIGRLYSLADQIIIRSGGLSSMEVEAVSHGLVFIHSAYEKESDDLSADLVRRGMPSWEGGNALHILNSLRNPDGSRRAYIVNTLLYPKVARMLHEQGRL